MNTKIFFRDAHTTDHHFPEAAILFEQEKLLAIKQDGTVVITQKSNVPVAWGLVEEFGTDIRLAPEIAATILSVHALLERVGGYMDFLKAGRAALNAKGGA